MITDSSPAAAAGTEGEKIAKSSSIVVLHLSHHIKVKDLNPATITVTKGENKVKKQEHIGRTVVSSAWG
jgi:hypothetical protein